MSRSSSKLGHVWSKTRLLGQILEKLSVHLRVHSFDSKLTKLYQNVNDRHVGSKTRWLGQLLEKPCVHSKRHSFDPKFMKLCQIVNQPNI